MRKAFNFYSSYYEVFKELNDAQKVTYMDALLKVNFLEVRIEEVSFKDPLLQVLWKSQKHSIEQSITGYLDIQKRSTVKRPFFGCYADEYTPSLGPTVGGENTPSLEVKGKGKGKGKEEGEGKEGVNPDTTLEGLPELKGVGKLINEQGLMELETAKALMRKDEPWQERTLRHLRRFDHVLSFQQLDKLIEAFFTEKADEPENLREGVVQYQLWFRNWVKVELKKRSTQKPEVTTNRLPQSKKLS